MPAHFATEVCGMPKDSIISGWIRVSERIGGREGDERGRGRRRSWRRARRSGILLWLLVFIIR
jgi:hypothetical protein